MKPPICPSCQSAYTVELKEYGNNKRGKHPMLLRCGHTFCEVCLQKNACADTCDTIQCPTCKLPTKQGSGVGSHSAISPDIYTVGLLWTRRLDLEHQSQKIIGKENKKGKKKESTAPSNNGTETGPRCVECQVNSATCQCFKCECCLCKSCFDKIHQASNTLKKHQPVPILDSDSADRMMLQRKTRSRICSSHEQCQIEYFCNDDKQAICSRCVIMGDHKGHAVQTMEDKNKECLSEMEPAIAAAQETVWRLEKSEKLINQTAPSSKTDTRDMVDQVRLHFQELHSLLQAREEQLLDEITEAAASSAKPFQETKSYLQNERVSLEMTLIDASRTKQGSIHKLVDADLVLERLKKATDIACVVTVNTDAMSEPIKFSFDSSLKKAIGSYGGISVVNSTQMLTLGVPGPDAEKPPVGELRNYSASDIDALSTTTDPDSISDVASVIMEEEKEETVFAEELIAAAGEPVKTESSTKSTKKKSPSPAPDRHLVPGHSEDTIVTHIRTPAQLYMQLTSRNGELMKMQREIGQHCRTTPAKKGQPEHLESGSLVLAQFSQDKNWYRAIVTEVVESKQTREKAGVSYKVFFMDYGNSETVPWQRLRPMKKKFESQPAFAYECSLYDTQPVNAAEGWTPEAVNVVLQMTGDGPVIMTVMNTDDGALEVDLKQPEKEQRCVNYGPESVRDTLLFLGLATCTSSPPETRVLRMKRDFISVSRIPDGTISSIGINCVYSPSLFYAQVQVDHSRDFLHQLILSIQDTYTEDNRHRYTLHCPKVDMMCIARYEADDKWYRAMVTGLPGHGKVTVQFVDFGNTEIVNHSDVLKILNDHAKLPRQALTCSLSDVEPVEHGEWSKEAEAWFKSTADLQLCQIRVMGYGQQPNSLVGVLYVIDGNNQLCCVNTELVRQGFARSTGVWSREEIFQGITLKPLEENHSPSTPRHDFPASAGGGSPNGPVSHSPKTRSSPSKTRQSPKNTSQPSSPRTPGSGKKSPSTRSTPSPSQTSAGPRNTALQNLHRQPEPQPSEKKLVATCSPESEAVEVLITGYHSPSHFFMQLPENHKQLLNLMQELASYETTKPSKAPWREGAYCVAKYSKDDRWYRGHITKQVNDNTFEVNLIDYGDVDLVSADRLRLLKKAHGGLECFAERCHLANVMPAATYDRTKWPATAVEFVANEIRAKRLFVKLEGNPVEDFGLPVDIMIEHLIPETALDPMTRKYVSLVSTLQEKGLAVPLTSGKGPVSPSPSQPVSTPSPANISTVGFSPNTSTVGFSPQSIKPADVVVADRPVQQTNEEDVKMVIEEPVPVQPDCSIAHHPPPTSSTLSIMPIFVDEDGIIYAHDFNEEELCTVLMEELAQYAKTAPTGELQVKTGQVCLAYYSEDNTWYRASVLSVGPNSVKVKYVDYGNTSKVDKTHLRPLPPELCFKPQMAYELVLHNIKPNTEDGSWPVSFLEYMHNQLINVQCTALVKGDPQQHPLAVDLLQSNGQSITTVLLESGAVTKEFDMEDYYDRSAEITNILSHSNPYFPLKCGSAGDVLHGLVTHIELPNLVYIQRCVAPSEESLPAEIRDFVQMMEDLNSVLPQEPALQEVPGAGEMCSARFSQDNRWYRGLIAKSYPASRSALVYYVDYGNSEAVPLDRLRSLPQQFQDTPAQALRAYLNVDLTPDTRRWTYRVYKAMAEAIFLRRHIVLIRHPDPLTVDLFTEVGEPVGAATLSYQDLLSQALIAVPTPVAARDTDDSVIVETYTEEEPKVSKTDETA